MPRQKAAGTSEAISQKITVIRTVCEVISGSLPMDQRKQFKQLLVDAPNAGIKKIFVESARAISRDADVGEEIYKKAKEQGIEICCKDSPGLFSLNPSPVQIFLRRVVLAMLELEKNLVVHRLKDGRKHAQEKANKEIKRLKRTGKKLKPGTKRWDQNLGLRLSGHLPLFNVFGCRWHSKLVRVETLVGVPSETKSTRC